MRENGQKTVSGCNRLRGGSCVGFLGGEVRRITQLLPLCHSQYGYIEDRATALISTEKSASSTRRGCAHVKLSQKREVLDREKIGSTSHILPEKCTFVPDYYYCRHYSCQRFWLKVLYSIDLCIHGLRSNNNHRRHLQHQEEEEARQTRAAAAFVHAPPVREGCRRPSPRPSTSCSSPCTLPAMINVGKTGGSHAALKILGIKKEDPFSYCLDTSK